MRSAMELRTYTFLDSLQPQLADFLQTVASGFLPLEHQASLFIEVAPGIAINTVTDTALKQTRVIPGMQIVERAYGLLELHHYDQGEVRQAGQAILDKLGLEEHGRLKPRIVSEQIITGIDGHHAALINRMRHGDMITQGQTLYTLEVHPAATGRDSGRHRVWRLWRGSRAAADQARSVIGGSGRNRINRGRSVWLKLPEWRSADRLGAEGVGTDRLSTARRFRRQRIPSGRRRDRARTFAAWRVRPLSPRSPASARCPTATMSAWPWRLPRNC